jgi:isopentenyl diphosphate isomerase/L-lactate dehydrogenase-like FMN-dependent dehydrogenase
LHARDWSAVHRLSRDVADARTGSRSSQAPGKLWIRLLQFEAVVAVAAAFRDEVGYEPPVSTPVMFDSGVRDATDVVIALALGATAVGIGRPYAYALSYGGAESLTHFLKSFLAEFDLCLAVCGFKDIAALKEAGCEPALH